MEKSLNFWHYRYHPLLLGTCVPYIRNGPISSSYAYLVRLGLVCNCIIWLFNQMLWLEGFIGHYSLFFLVYNDDKHAYKNKLGKLTITEKVRIFSSLGFTLVHHKILKKYFFFVVRYKRSKSYCLIMTVVR